MSFRQYQKGSDTLRIKPGNLTKDDLEVGECYLVVKINGEVDIARYDKRGYWIFDGQSHALISGMIEDVIKKVVLPPENAR